MSLEIGHENPHIQHSQGDGKVKHIPLTTFNVSLILTARPVLNSPAATYINKPHGLDRENWLDSTYSSTAFLTNVPFAESNIKQLYVLSHTKTQSAHVFLLPDIRSFATKQDVLNPKSAILAFGPRSGRFHPSHRSRHDPPDWRVCPGRHVVWIGDVDGPANRSRFHRCVSWRCFLAECPGKLLAYGTTIETYCTRWRPDSYHILVYT